MQSVYTCVMRFDAMQKMYIRTYIMAVSIGLGKLCTRCDNVTYALNGPWVVRPSTTGEM